MVLTNKAITAIDKQDTRLKLALGLGFTEQWIIKVIAKNKENGILTTAMALTIIRQETGFSDEDILEGTTEEAQK